MAVAVVTMVSVVVGVNGVGHVGVHVFGVEVEDGWYEGC